MKYSAFILYRAWLSKKYTTATADTYCKAIDYLLKEQLLLDCRKMNIDSVVTKLKAMKYKNQYSKYKSAFILFCEFLDIKLSDIVISELQTMNTEKIKKRRRLKQTNLKDIKNRIKTIRDKKLKLSYETMLTSGLRVSELSQIKKEDCSINDNSIVMWFCAKGGNKESVVISDKRIIDKLKDLINSTENNAKVYYSSNYLQTKARELGFMCHDLRRAFAKVSYQKYKDINKVTELLRHKNTNNTMIYLNSKIKI